MPVRHVLQALREEPRPALLYLRYGGVHRVAEVVTMETDAVVIRHPDGETRRVQLSAIDTVRVRK